MAPPLNQDEQLAELYHWVDTIPLSRPKRNISRDFSDGVLMAEVISYCTPKLVELHNYSAANAVERKAYNWSTLNRELQKAEKVFRRLGMRLERQEIQDIVNARPGAVEKVLALYRQQAAEYSARITEQDATFAVDIEPDDRTTRIQLSIEAEDAVSEVPAAEPAGSSEGRPPSVTGPVYFDTYQTFNMLKEKEETIAELQETNVIMREKIKHLEQLLSLKDERIAMLTQELSRCEAK